jgi:plasmid stabilization system protein ParE
MNEYKLLQRKPSKITEECVVMLEEAAKYIKKTSPMQARIMKMQFMETRKTIERMPKIGAIHRDGIRKKKLGKFKYYIYYRETETAIEILGIHHTSRGTEF